MITGCKDIKQDFKKETGLTIQYPIKAVHKNDTYFVTEGEYSIVFKTTSNQVHKWLTSSPPWKEGKWEHGSIPGQIGMHCKFYFPAGTGLIKKGTGQWVYAENNALTQMLNDTSNYYTFRERCCPESGSEELRFHKGDLLVLQTDSNKVWYSSWDY